MDKALATPLEKRREPFCIVGFPEEVVFSVVSVEKDGIIIIVGVKGMSCSSISLSDPKVQTPYVSRWGLRSCVKIPASSLWRVRSNLRASGF